MASLDGYRQTIETLFTDYAQLPYAYEDIRTEAVFDRVHDRYLLVNVGWDNGQRIHSGLVHIDIIAGKLWIQKDETEHGIVKELVQAGVPKDRIVLGFHPAHIRPHTEYATG